jgi:Holliday junction resolvasome RuvABC endonuclease subunit
MKIIGLDLSLKSTGVSDGLNLTDVIRTHDSLRSHERIAYLWSHIADWTFGADLVMVEGPAFGSAANQGGEELSWLRGEATRRLWVAGTPYVVVPPSNLKMFATGKGNASKDEVTRAAEMFIGKPLVGPVKYSKHDMADAYWLAQMGHVITGNVDFVGLARPSRDALSGCDWTRAVDLLNSLGVEVPQPKPKRRKKRAVSTAV